MTFETPAQRDRHLEAERINAAYAARRTAGLADNDAGMGRLAEAETRDWHPRQIDLDRETKVG